MNACSDHPRVVVIDDDPAFFTLMDDILGDAGYRASGWPASRGALDRLRRLHPAVVILDLWLEDPAAGWRLLAAIDADPGLRHLPGLFCPGDHPALRARAATLARAGRRTLSKPFDLDDLLETIAA